MSFLAKQPQLPQSASAADPKRSSSYKSADVVPMGWGRDVYSPHWISNKYDEHTQKAGSNKPDWQYCSIAAAYCAGPIDFVGFVFRDGKLTVELDYTFAPGEESHTFDIQTGLASGRVWQAVVHRGTEDADPAIVANLNAKTGQNHPPMRGVVWIEWLNIDLGQGSAALPALAVEFGRHAPAIDAYAGGDSHPYGVNPFAAIYALLTAKNGGDFDAALLDPVHWGAQCTALEAIGVSGRTGNLVHCHPSFAGSTSLGDALSQILAYIDGYVYAHEGTLRVGWFPSAAVDASTLPEITEHDLEAVPSGGGFPDWNEGPSSAVVTFKSFDRDYDEDAARYNAPANRENNVIAEPVRKERPFIHAADQAAAMASESATDPQGGEVGSNLTVFKSRAVNGGAPLMPGDLFNWDYGPHALDLVCRLTTRRMRMGAASDILTVTRERGAYPRPYVAPVDPRVAPEADDPGEINIADVRLWLLPSGLTSQRMIAPLVDRTKRTIYRADLHLSTAGAAPWEVILDSRFFAAKVIVSGAGVGGGDATIRIDTSSVDWPRMQAQNAIAQADNTLLLLVGDELMSVGDITAVDPDTFDLAILRGRLGTVAAAHAAAVVGFVFYRSEIASIEHAEFYRVRDLANVYNAGIATKYFKLQLFTIGVEGLAKPNDPGIAFTLPDLSADETKGYTIVLTNEAHSVATDAAGAVLAGQLGAGSTAKSTVKVYRGATLLTAVAAGPNSDQFSIAIGTLTNTTATKEANDRVRCDTLTSDNGTIEISVNVAGAFTLTKVFTLSKSKTGATGTTGDLGPGIVAMGDYDATRVYYQTATRRDVVKYGGNWWITNDAAKSGTATWGTPGVADWDGPYSSYRFVATALLLAEDATIINTLVMGDGATGNGGIIRSVGATAIMTGKGFWMNPRNGSNETELRIGDPAGNYLRWDGAVLSVVGAFSSSTFDAGTGVNRIRIDGGTSLFGQKGLLLGLNSAGNPNVLISDDSGVPGLLFQVGTTLKGSIKITSGGQLVITGSVADSAEIASFDLLSSQNLEALSSSDPRNTDAPIYTAGGAYIAKSLDVLGQIGVAGGDASTPGVAIRGDLDTGMYSDEADKLKFACGGSQVMRLLRTGGANYLRLATGATLQLGNTRSAITTEVAAYFVTALDDSGNTLKILCA